MCKATHGIGLWTPDPTGSSCSWDLEQAPGQGFLTAALCSRGQREGPGTRAPSLASQAAAKRCGAARTPGSRTEGRPRHKQLPPQGDRRTEGQQFGLVWF